MPNDLGNIVIDDKTFTPVYTLSSEEVGGGSGSIGENLTTIPGTNSSIAICSYSSTIYGLALASDGSLYKITWNRTDDPVVTATGDIIPTGASNPQSNGFIVSLGYINATSNNFTNQLVIDQIEGEELKEGTLSLGAQTIHVYTSSNLITVGTYRYIYYSYGPYITVVNNTNKNLKISFTGEYNGDNLQEINVDTYQYDDISFQIDVNANSSSNRTYFGNNNASSNPDYYKGQSYICNLTITFND